MNTRARPERRDLGWDQTKPNLGWDLILFGPLHYTPEPATARCALDGAARVCDARELLDCLGLLPALGLSAVIS